MDSFGSGEFNYGSGAVSGGGGGGDFNYGGGGDGGGTFARRRSAGILRSSPSFLSFLRPFAS
jgi:hypothetical protein